jgi:hypothetical protein
MRYKGIYEFRKFFFTLYIYIYFSFLRVKFRKKVTKVVYSFARPFDSAIYKDKSTTTLLRLLLKIYDFHPAYFIWIKK